MTLPVYHKQDFFHQKTDALNQLIENVLPLCKGIAFIYCKTDEQANEWTKQCFLSALKELLTKEADEFNDNIFVKQFIICLVKKTLENRTGELIADTTIVSVFRKKEANLFANSEYYKNLSPEELIQHIRKLNTLQQVIFNMIVLDGFTVQETSSIIQHNELSVKALIEKARYNVFSSIKSIV